MEKNELYHHGIKGMRWGVRRYQNKDGSLTPAGQKRYDRDVSGLNEKNKRNYKTDPDKWVKEDLERTRRLTDETGNLTGKLKNMNDAGMRNKPRTKMDLSSMTDQQMRNEINRALLERQYNDMFAPKKVNRGREIAGKVLETSGSVLAIGSSALGIALAIKELRG